MGTSGELGTHLENYLNKQIELEFVQVHVPGDALNVGEIADFRVKVTNKGAIDLKGVTLRISALNGAKVANGGAAAPFVNDFVTQELETVAAHGGSQLTVGSPLKLKAPDAPQPVKNLMKAALDKWTSALTQALSDQGDMPKAYYAAAVRAK